ncbi:MAG: glycosyltransferase [Candidatus Caldarchaeum sp.]
MNVWFLCTEYPPFPGGVSTYVGNMSRLLAQAGHKVTVLAYDRERDDEEYTPEGVRVIRFQARASHLSALPPASGKVEDHPAFPFNIMSWGPALSYQFAEELRHRLSEEAELPDIIECQDFLAIAYFILQRRLTGDRVFKKLPILIHLHSPMFEVYRINQFPRYKLALYWIGEMEKFSILAADGLISPSQYLKDCVCSTLQRSLPIEVIPYPYRFEDFAETLAANYQPQPGDLVYGGRLEVRKGVLPLVKACARLWNQGYNFRLTLIGGDTEFYPRGVTVRSHLFNQYRRFIQSGHLAITKEPLPQKELYQRYAKAWAVVVPSIWENFPNVCIEAMALGKVVIASTAGGQAEMIEADGRYGLLFDWAVPGDCERALQRVLAMSAEENRQLGLRAAQRIRELTDPQKILSHRMAHYQKVIENHRSRASCRVFPTVATPRKLSDVKQTQNQSQDTRDLLSVVIPYYNLGPYLKEALESVLASTYEPLEVIIVNDASDAPSSVKELLSIERQADPRVRIVHHRYNQGLAAARNTGALAACGEFLAFLDADDIVEPEFFARAVAILKSYDNVDFVYSWLREFGEVQGAWITWNTEFPYLLGHNICSVTGVVIKRSSWLTYGMHRTEMEYAMEDYETWIRMVAAGCIGISIPEFLVRYRVRRESMLRQMNPNQALYLYDVISHYNPEIYQRYGVELFNLQNANGPAYLWPHPGANVPWPQLIDTPVNAISAPSSSTIVSEIALIASQFSKRLNSIPGRRGTFIRKLAKLGYRMARKTVRLILRV